MKLSVVILNYKVPYHLLLCLDSVTRATEHIEAEIIVVDNNSEDESCDLVQQHFPKVILIKNTKNSGFSKGNNSGVKKAKGEYVCLLNPDVVVPEDCFTRVLAYHQDLKNPGAIGVQLVDGSGEFLNESKRNIPTPRVALKKLLGNSSAYYNFDLKKDANGPTDILVGAFMFMKTELYRSTGGLDEDYFMYGEDIDLSYRIRKAGFQNYYCGETQVLHFKGESTTKDEVYLKNFFEAMSIFYRKHFRTYKTSFKLVKLSLKPIMAFEKLKINSIKIQTRLVENISLISENQDLKQALKTKFGTAVNIMTTIPSEQKNSLIVLDANFISYKECIKTIINLKSRNTIFRIKPGIFNFMIGSESKHKKGEVTDLS
ncbi:glycosyltransferase family 2 protein [Psychroflexus sp. YR1-1]|uniref:Glycosyltransferase family 2 protein n=1 Tax=Psychroflexus aurantiacus TaxID=2709310 RepID=A0A6B3R5T7_9FLAO|nr:glycosyltransferase family 2 protein [Psychroflexus aurantiacus]NEV94940.1 glycosyltransferase family 2 protein [Psychroflexus aurantiacus]